MSEPSDPGTPAFRELTGRVADRYEIQSLVGKGAMGQVYRAHDTVLDRPVALKVMAAQIADDPELKHRFEREARAVAKMTHPNVLTVFDLGSLPDGSPYIAMEFLDGKDLQKSARVPGGMTLERKVQIIVHVLTGLNHAHQRGIIHRDIKPANIFILDDGSVKIMDFGVARLSSHTMTADGNIVGTADYMSPEQVKGDKVDGRSDLFAVGCMLYELVTGRRPFHSDNLMAIFYKITHDPPLFDLVPGGAEYDALLPILKKALAKSIDERYQTAYDFAVDLREWLRAHATTESTQHVLESLVDLEAPTHAPQPLTEAPGGTLVGEGRPSGGATVELGERQLPSGRRGLPGPTQVAGRTVVEARGAAPPRAAAQRTVTVPPMARPALRARRARRSSPLPWAVGGLVLVGAAGAGGFYYWKGRQEARTPPPTLAAAPPVTEGPPPTTLATPTPPPVTAAPQPRFEEAKGKAAASVRAAQAAFRRGDYDRAVAAAQQALRDEESNPQARAVLSRALQGQKATGRVHAGTAALQRGDLDGADREVQAAYAIAPWDGGVADLKKKIDAARLHAAEQAREQAKQKHTTEINRLLDQGTTALQSKQYDAAIAAYERVLALDPNNMAAQNGKTGAASAKAVAEAATAGGGAPAASGHSFVAGATVARGAEVSSGGTPAGFMKTPEVDAKRASQAASLPGKLLFEASPPSPRPGDRYSVSAFLLNEGLQPIELATMIVTTTINGRKLQGPVKPMVSVVAPKQRARVYQSPSDVWKEETASWSMEIQIHTSKNETYQSTLSWK
jgi:tRNA A-37 threonylcarbamoyl transferase component Bud32/tetratricopeptide (TPR) repeat protein